MPPRHEKAGLSGGKACDDPVYVKNLLRRCQQLEIGRLSQRYGRTQVGAARGRTNVFTGAPRPAEEPRGRGEHGGVGAGRRTEPKHSVGKESLRWPLCVAGATNMGRGLFSHVTFPRPSASCPALAGGLISRAFVALVKGLFVEFLNFLVPRILRNLRIL